jgi:hypothetical protein
MSDRYDLGERKTVGGFWNFILPGLKFLAPHILNIIKDAVDQFNPGVSSDMVDLYDKVIDNIGHKLKVLPEFDQVMDDKKIDSICRATRSADSILKFGDAANTYFQHHYNDILLGYLYGVCSNSDGLKMRVMNKLSGMMSQFETSKAMNGILPILEPMNRKVLLIEDALLALARIHPRRQLSSFENLVVQDLEIHTVYNLSEIEADNRAQLLSGFYKVDHYSSRMSISVTVFTPCTEIISGSLLSEIYGMNLLESPVLSVMKARPLSEYDFISEDPNLSVDRLIGKVLGASITSLSTVCFDLFSFMAENLARSGYIKGNPDEIKKKSIELVMKGPWRAIDDATVFMSPVDLYRRADEGQSLRLSEDFATLTDFLQVYRFCVASNHLSDSSPVFEFQTKLYPSLRRCKSNNYVNQGEKTMIDHIRRSVRELRILIERLPDTGDVKMGGPTLDSLIKDIASVEITEDRFAIPSAPSYKDSQY